MTMKPCNVRHLAEWYHVDAHGTVTVGKGDGGAPVSAERQKAVRQTVQRLRGNKARRLRDAARRDFGMVKTPYGWE